MAANILSGKPIADTIRYEVRSEVSRLREVHGVVPILAVVRVGQDAASAVYVGSKVRTAEQLGIVSQHIHLEADVGQEELVKVISGLNADADVDGILVQLPLPQHIDERHVLECVAPEKDVDGFHPLNAGKLMLGYAGLVPCTPAGIIEILERSSIPVAGKHAVLIGRSNIVGKPLALLLLAKHATVTVCHSRTTHLAEITRQADILIAAIGRPGLVTREHIREGATVIDVGINSISDPELARMLFPKPDIDQRLQIINERGHTLVGDVNPRDAMEVAGHYTPVPGGVGLLTVAMLMRNTVIAAKARRQID
jgi:methylenetetrahydrofolate dehydrogenase (NADP+) / methenyltetrahydrofolate cyclohydrolase